MENELDDILNLEEQYYNEGFIEGQNESTKKQLLEGKEYGYQTGFQRFLIVGYISGLIEFWYKNINSYDQKSLKNHLDQSQIILDGIKMTNFDDDVEKYEKSLIKLRNKIRIITNLVKEQWKFKDVDDLVKEIGGIVQLNENVNDMW
ncbi:protein Lto1p [[Candida] jaroonii]|uniref:Protein Lto1p n=1 Tax=[Candida] jaroonii TaxID=467808 RepID=A0ACA9YBX6_9ASCO|nr:protein Lto1p [[Candida] jaroonii]